MANERMTRGDTAKNFFTEGYNCTQAVVLAFEDLLGESRDSLVRAASSFGGGIGRLREVCGAVSGMAIVMGLVTGYATPETGSVKTDHYAHIQVLGHRFEEARGTLICRKLLEGTEVTPGAVPEARTPQYYEKRPCPDIVKDAADILENYLKENFPDVLSGAKK